MSCKDQQDAFLTLIITPIEMRQRRPRIPENPSNCVIQVENTMLSCIECCNTMETPHAAVAPMTAKFITAV